MPPSAAVQGYPDSPREGVIEDYHGTSVADPYRWLEDDHSDRTASWVNAQNELTFKYLGEIPQREGIKKRLTELWNFERFGLPVERGGRYFYTRNDGLQPQASLMVSEGLTGEPRVLLDPSTLRADGTAALANTQISDDGNLLAYGIADGGSDWEVYRVRDVRTGKDLPDVTRWIKFSGVSWGKDARGYYYARYDEPQAGAELTAVNRFPKVYYHALGAEQKDDTLLYERPDQPEWGMEVSVSDDGQFLVLIANAGTDTRNVVFVRELGAGEPTGEMSGEVRQVEQRIGEALEAAESYKPTGDAGVDAPARAALDAKVRGWQLQRAELLRGAAGRAHGFIELLSDADAAYAPAGNVGRTFYFRTDLDAPRGRVIAINLDQPQRGAWREVVAQNDATLVSASIIGGRLVCDYLRDASSRLVVHELDGTLVREVTLPGIGSVSGISGRPDKPEAFYAYMSYTTPTSVYRYDVGTGESAVYRAPKTQFESDQYATRQVFFTSADGTRVPMFITHRRDLVMDGTNPVLLYGYGGFNAPMTPGFSVIFAQWMEMGGVYAVANIRGGGEYGKAWHESAIKLNRPRAFEDFQAAARWLCENNVTRPDRLAIMGGSNGGLLVGACLTQTPELYGAAIAQVGVMDMLRFHKFTIGWAWTSDFGSSDNPEEFRVLYGYSPYHAMLRAKPGTKYPATLILTGDHDDRVVPGHSFKFAAAMQAVADPQSPALIRIETRAGHGAGKPTSKRIDEAADMWSFLFRALNMEPARAPK